MQKHRRYFYFLMVMLLPAWGKAQSNSLGDKDDAKVVLSPKAHRAHIPHHKKVVFKKPKVQHTAVYEFYERIEQAAKDKQRLLRKLAKPQYSNPLYFGHKHPPKKHRPDKIRYCKECGIRH